MLTPVKVEGFSGGITDFPIGAAPDQYQYARNLLVTKAGQTYTRPGSVPFSVAFTQLPTGNQRVGSLWSFNEDTALVATSGRRGFRFSAGWPELLGPTGNPLLSSGGVGNRVSGSDWKAHLLLTNDGGSLPTKIFQDATGAYRTITMGLPKFLPLNSYAATTVVTATIRDFVNAIRTQMLAHFANTNYATAHANPDTGGGSSTTIITAPVLIAGDSFATAKVLVSQLARAYTNHHADAVATKALRAYHPQIYDNPGAPNIGITFIDAPTSWLVLAQQVNEIKRNFNWHVSSFKGHVDTGGPHQPPLVNDRVAAANLAGTDQGPTFSDLNFNVLTTFANRLKKNINDHMADTAFSHPLANGPSGVTDVEDQIQMIDAVDSDSLFELSVHIYCGYRDHQADATFPIYQATGATHHAAGQQKLFDAINQGVYNIRAGMQIVTLGGGAAGDNFPANTTVSTINTGTLSATMSQNNSGDGTDGARVTAHFTLSKYHYIGQQVSFDGTAVFDLNFISDAQKGDLETFEFGFDPAIADPGTLSGMLADIATKFNAHDNNYGFVPTGSPFPNPTIHPSYATHQVGTDTIPAVQGFIYGYAFLYKHEYKTLSGENFIVRGAPYFKNKNSYYNIVDSSTAIPDLSTFTNTTANAGANNYLLPAVDVNNYDLANTVVEIYRTIAGGQVLYYAGSVPLGTTIFKDAISDGDIIAEEKIYTNGGVLSNDPPPVCKFMHVTQAGTPYFGSVSNVLLDETIETIPQRVQQGIDDSPDSAPSGNFVDLPAAVMGLSSVRTIPIAFTKNATYRLEGRFDEQGQGSIVAITISDRVGLVGSFSPVQVDGAVVFAGPDQFYMTDGYTMMPLGRAWPTTYANIVSGVRAYNIQGVYDKKSNRAWIGATATGADNDSCFIFDMNFPATPNACWTTADNGTYFAPTALTVFNGQIIRGDTRGYVFTHDEQYTSDPRLDPTGVDTTAVGWFTRWIPFQYRGPAFDYGLSGFRKWASVIETKFYNLGDLSAQVTGINDMGRTVGNCTPIRSRNWTATINERRFFPAGSLYFALKQIEITRAKVVITNSDTLATATVTGGTTVTIDAGTFPPDMVDFVIAFAGDGYVAEFPLNNQNGGNTVLTTVGAPNGVGQKWVIRGMPKTEKMQLQEYTTWATQMGANQTTATGETGANA